VVQWCSGVVAQWRSGAVAQWRSGAVAQWRSGAVAQWRSGAVVQCSKIWLSLVNGDHANEDKHTVFGGMLTLP